MTRITSFVVCIGLLCLGAAPRASADPIIITGGTFLVTGISESGSISIVGTRGFSLVSQVDTLEGRVDPTFNCTPCGTGVSTISIGAYQAGTSFFGPVTLDGVTYHVGDGIDDPEFIAFEIFGIAPVPGLESLPTSVTAPFTLAGNFFASLAQGRVPIEGRGIATLFLRPDSSCQERNVRTDTLRLHRSDTCPGAFDLDDGCGRTAGGHARSAKATRKAPDQPDHQLIGPAAAPWRGGVRLGGRFPSPLEPSLAASSQSPTALDSIRFRFEQARPRRPALCSNPAMCQPRNRFS